MTTATAKTESWDERIAREKAEEKALVNSFVTKLEAAAAILGWTLEVVTYDETPSYAKLHHETGACISISLPGRYASRNGKVEASASWPKDADGKQADARDWQLVKYGEANPFNIGFSFKKTAKAIASDLNRRLIPQVLEGIVKVNEKLAAQKTEQAGIETDVERLRKAFDTHDVRGQTHFSASLHFNEYTSYDGRVNRDGGNGIDGELRLSTYNPDDDADGNTVDLKLSNLSVEQAVAIAELLKS